MSRNQYVAQLGFYRTFRLVHNLVHNRLNFCGRHRGKSLPLYLRPNVSVPFPHA